MYFFWHGADRAIHFPASTWSKVHLVSYVSVWQKLPFIALTVYALKGLSDFYRRASWTNRALFKVALRLISRKRGESFEVVLFRGSPPGVTITVVCLRPRYGCDRCKETKLIGHDVFYNEKRIGTRVSIHLTSLGIKDSFWTQFIPGPRGLPLMRTRERQRANPW